MSVTLSNPRRKVVIDDYPLGGSKRGQCTFEVHDEKRGTRVSKQTTGKPKFTTYGGKAAICDGSDGRTYIVMFTQPEYGPFIKIYDSTFHSAHAVNDSGSVFDRDQDRELFAYLKGLIESAQ